MALQSLFFAVIGALALNAAAELPGSIDCRLVRCASPPPCPGDVPPRIPPGQCCLQCPPTQPDCPIKGQEFQQCQTCPQTCAQFATGELIACPLVCRPGCGCPVGQYIDEKNLRCVEPEDCPKPDICDLPQDAGFCRAFFRRYYFNPSSGECEEFIYGGCGGNKNNFRTLEECERTCSIPTEPPTLDCRLVDCAPPPACCKPGFELRIREGQCCQECLPIDCSNAPCPLIRCAPGFVSQVPEGECCAECVPSPPPPPDPFTVDECALLPDPGPCRARLPRYYFNDTTQTCMQFTYGGCLGNDNRFCTAEDCLEACSSTTPDCSLIPCPDLVCGRGFEPRVPEGECCVQCLPIDCTRVLCPPPPTCQPGFQPLVLEGECCERCLPNCTGIFCDIPICDKGFEPRALPGECCPGCQPIRVDCTGILCGIPICEEGFELLTLPGECCPGCQPIPANCTGILCDIPICEKGFEPLTLPGQCCPGCQPIQVNCTGIQCDIPICEDGFEPLTLPGECCPGCQPCPVEGSFFTECATVCPPTCESPFTICLALCQPGCACPPGQVVDTKNNRCVDLEECPRPEDVCTLPPEMGPCEAFFPSFFFNATSGQCEEFIYGGCGGNDNRFSTVEECKERCDICSLPPETGPCRAFIPSFFFNATSGRCERFIYGGCGGNDNRFSTVRECEERCIIVIEFDPVDYRVKEDAVTVALTIVKRGRNVEPVSVLLSNVDVIAEDGEDYKAIQELLVTFPPGGSSERQVLVTILDDDVPEGKEDFRAELSLLPNETEVVLGEASIAVIEIVDDDVDICTLPPEAGPCEAFIPSFFFNATSDRCERFIYGGCLGNDNRFSTVQECEERCDICFLPPETGPCRAFFPSFFFNATSGQCEEFVYGGCLGNDNRFETVRECEDRCDPCANFTCPSGSECKTFNGEPFCEPSCDLQNGGCPENTICRLEPVICVRAPCPPRVVCEPIDPPTCQPPESVSRCPLPFCLGPICPPPPPDSVYRCCPPGHQCAVFQPTGETFCDPSCDLDNGGCPEGTVCRLNPVVCVRPPCPPVIECVNASECPLIGQEFVLCKRCQRTCEQVAAGEQIFCILVCLPGCSCPIGQVIDEANNRCVEEEDCPVTSTVSVQFSPVEYRVRESAGSVTLVLEKTGRSNSEVTVFLSTTDVDATAGLDYEATRQRVTFPPGGAFRSRQTVSIVINDDRLRESKEDFRAELFIPESPINVGANVVLGEDSVAVVIIEDDDIDPCATVRCRAGHQCKVFEPTGEAFCDPSCELSNGGCPDGKVCRLRTVFCIRAPCPPIIACVDPSAVCSLPPEAGPCRAFIPSFFFNATSGQCERFIYGGCGGNDNRFSTLKECESACDTCSLPPDPGPCRAAFPAYFFNSTSQRCERFIYGGCQGNANRFASLASCTRRCGERCPNKGEEFLECVRCPNNRPTCENHDQINICLVICQPGCDCPFPLVLDEEADACVDPEECPDPCPPTCSPDFCRGNGRGLCSLPENSKESLSCNGRCEVTFCRACYFGEEAREAPDCGDCEGFEVQNNHCFRQWGRCTKRAQSNFERLRRRMRTEENFRCHAPVCALE